jgi:hypothetical protein
MLTLLRGQAKAQQERGNHQQQNKNKDTTSNSFWQKSALPWILKKQVYT